MCPQVRLHGMGVRAYVAFIRVYWHGSVVDRFMCILYAVYVCVYVCVDV